MADWRHAAECIKGTASRSPKSAHTVRVLKKILVAVTGPEVIRDVGQNTESFCTKHVQLKLIRCFSGQLG